MTMQRQVTDFITQLVSLFQGLSALFQGSQKGFDGLTSHLAENAGILGPLTDNGFSTPFGPPTYMTLGSDGSSGYILIDDINEPSYIGVAQGNYGSVLQGLYLFRSGTITIGPDGKSVPNPVLGQNIAGASPAAIIVAWSETVGSDDRAQLLFVIAVT